MTENTFTPPEIDYLSKDYASFRQVMRDHLAALIPDWQEQNPSDIGNALVDLLAYAGDYLSYYQDAVATEAYLGTARRRVSVHRHTRLLDYHLHEGCNARALVQVKVNDEVTLPRRTQLVTRATGPTVIEFDSSAYSQILGQPVHFFETMHPAILKEAHNEIRFYVPEGADVNLSVGATHASLQDAWAPGKEGKEGILGLQAGDILVFKEVRNPETGSDTTADPTHRHAVRLTRVFAHSQAGKPLVDISWHPADALPFSMVLKRYAEKEEHTDVSVACGNIILADHGRTMCEPLALVEPGERYAPRLTDLILTYNEPLALSLPVRETLHQNPRKSKPAVQLWQVGPRMDGSPEGKRMPVRGRKDRLLYDARQARTIFEREGNEGQVEVYQTIPWTSRQELLNSDPMARDYQVELIDSREARLKFGFGGMGWQPQAGDEFIAAFRVGSGVAGNVGVGAIAHIILPKGSADRSKIKDEGVSNLLPAVGGQGRESLETARLLAPANLQTQARCVTLADYEDVARLHPDVAEARAHWKWVANTHIVVLHIHRRNGLPVDRSFQGAFLDYMRPYQIVGSEIQVRGPNTWPVYLWLTFSPASYASRNGLREALKAAFSDQEPAGFFYRQNFSLGQPLYRSQIITHASRLTGIQDVRLVHFCNEPFGKDRVEQVLTVPATAIIGLQALEIQDLEINDG
jgi:hypothetical protein